MEFSEQYRNPEWQKKRLEVLSRSNFTCEQCGCNNSTIHVHHKRYLKGRKVWEYDLENFEALCQPCHHENHKAKNKINDLLASVESYQWEDLAELIEGWISDSDSSVSPGMIAKKIQYWKKEDLEMLYLYVSKSTPGTSGLVD